MTKRAVAQIAPIATLALFAVALLALIRKHPRYEADSLRLIAGLFNLRDCLRAGQHHCVGVDTFPLLQYLTGYAFLNDIDPFSPARAWVVISAASLAISVGVMFLVIRRTGSMAGAWAACLVLLTGPLLYYSASTFGEMEAAMVTLLYTAAMVRGAPAPLRVLLFVVAAMTKETASPFLALIWFIALLATWKGKRRAVMELLSLSVAMALAAGISAAFNEYRYGLPFNVSEMETWRRVPTIVQYASNFAGLWFSPSGGLATFWFSFFALMVGTLICVRQNRLPVRRLAPAGGVILLLFGLIAGFADYWSPFGWFCWGPRYLVPWIPSVTMILAHYYPAEIERMLRRLLGSAKAFRLAAMILCIVALPQFLVISGHGNEWMDGFFAPTPHSPPMGDAQHLDRHYAFLNYLAWRRYPPMPLLILQRLGEATGAIQGAIYVAAITSVLVLIRRSLRPDPARGRLPDSPTSSATS